MICWRCGAAMEDTLDKCLTCGAEKPPVRRQRTVANEAAKRYHERMQAPGDETTVQRVVARKQAKASAPQARQPAKPTKKQDTRNASERPDTAKQRPQGASRARSMPPGGAKPPLRPQTAQAGQAAASPRMVRRHSYEAIVPDTQGYDHINWLRLCIIAVVCVILLVAGVYLFLTKTGPGQRWLASTGRDASVEAYHEVGRTYMRDGAVSKGIWSLEIAQIKEPDNLEILLDLGRAYTGNDQPDRAELAYAEAIRNWDAHPDAYRLLIDILLDQQRNYEAMGLLDIAREKTGDSYFETLYNQLIPAPPTVSKSGSTAPFQEEFEIVLETAEEGGRILYTLKGEDPKEDGVEYTGPIYLSEQGWRLRAVVEKDGIFSREQMQSYVISKPIPDMPRSRLQSGTYDRQRTAALYGGDESDIIYYTVDGTQATTESKVYTEPVQLAIGNTTIRAIAVNTEGKQSNELSIAFKCNGTLKKSMDESDTVAGLKLYGTTRSAFEEKYGKPLSEQPDGEDISGLYTKLTYPFGYATFLERGDNAILAELSTNSTAFSGPRGTGIGSRMEDVIGAYGDMKGEANIRGDRILYNYTTGRLGMLTKTGEDTYEIGYYCRLENRQYVSITYFVKAGLVERMEWVRYTPA